MRLYRSIIFPFLLACALLFAQHTGAAHALRHALGDLTQHQEDKQAPHSDACEKCADYAHLGSALKADAYNFIPLVLSETTLSLRTESPRFTRTLPAVARGPPSSQRIA